ncbi:MAG: KilA-N domain-containing protein [Holophagaceae bacterium]|nr:KilA-N domain-containing protein [Holophagaceae bacterium]
MSRKEVVTVQGTEIALLTHRQEDYISLTDMAGYKENVEARIVISNWMSTYYTLEYLAIWEEFNNPDFNRMGFQSVRNAEGRLIMSPKRWIEVTTRNWSCCTLGNAVTPTASQRRQLALVTRNS